MIARLPPILLASSSVYRRELLQRILPEFDCAVPEVDESPVAGESPEAAALRLSRFKAFSCAKAHPEAVVIGSDQVPARGDIMLGKPGSRDRAIEQLQACSGRQVNFYTAVSVTGPGPKPMESFVDKTVVQFRPVNDEQIQRYIDKEQPYDCAGSFKVEALGIVLFESIDTRDPTALQGLPLIWLSDCLDRRGIPLL